MKNIIAWGQSWQMKATLAAIIPASVHYPHSNTINLTRILNIWHPGPMEITEAGLARLATLTKGKPFVQC